jgi:hypothetical protein
MHISASLLLHASFFTSLNAKQIKVKSSCNSSKHFLYCGGKFAGKSFSVSVGFPPRLWAEVVYKEKTKTRFRGSKSGSWAIPHIID